MEKTVQTRRYQDPLEGSFEKLVPWTFTFTNVDENSTVHIAADDWSDRKISLPIGVILEMAEVIRLQQSLNSPQSNRSV